MCIRDRPTNCVSPPGKHFIPLSLSTSLNSSLTIFRSSNTNLLTRPAGITSNFSSQAFSVSAPSTSNCLPAHIRSIDTRSTFKRHLKFHLFPPAFTIWSNCASISDSFSRFLALYKFVCIYTGNNRQHLMLHSDAGSSHKRRG